VVSADGTRAYEIIVCFLCKEGFVCASAGKCAPMYVLVLLPLGGIISVVVVSADGTRAYEIIVCFLCKEGFVCASAGKCAPMYVLVLLPLSGIISVNVASAICCTIAYTVCIGVLCVAIDRLHCIVCVQASASGGVPMVGIIIGPYCTVYAVNVIIISAAFRTILYSTVRKIMNAIIVYSLHFCICIITVAGGGVPMVGGILLPFA